MALSRALSYLRAFPRSPKSGKTRFKLRTLSNFLLAIAIFVPLAFLFAWFWSEHMAYAWLADAISIGLLFFLYQKFWNKRPIWIRCPKCFGRIATNTAWICGECKTKNENVDDFPFVYRCESCGIEPKSYQCHHLDENKKVCGKLIFFTDDESLRNYAYCSNPPYLSEEGKDDPESYEKEKRLRDYKISLKNLDIEIEQVEKKFAEASKRPLTPEEKIEASWAKRRAQTVTAAEIYRRVLKENAEKFKDDPDMREKADQAVKDWYESGQWEHIV